MWKAESRWGEERYSQMSARKMNVLLVDDNVQFLKAAHDVLAALPCVASIACAHSGVEALTRLGDFKADVVLTDIVMPDMSGFELIRKLRAGDAPPRLLAVTLHEGPEYRAAVRRSGAEGMVCKREFGKAAPLLMAAMAGVHNA